MWKFNLSGDIRICFLRASVECSLLYLSKSSALTTAVEKQLDGCDARLVGAALNVSWKDHISNKESQISPDTSAAYFIYSGHCWRSKNENVC